MNRIVFVVALVVGLAIILAFILPIDAQTVETPKPKNLIVENQNGFGFDDERWASKQAFVESGVRCATKKNSTEDAQAVGQKIERFQQNRLQTGSSKAKRAIEFNAARETGSIIVNVYFHVINRGEGIENGDVSQTMIDEQIAVLNDSFNGNSGGAQTPFRFALVEVDRTTNPIWYTARDGSQAEREMKTALRRGDLKTLNVYTTRPGGGILGWAYFPSDIAGDSVLDGVVVRFSTLPGGTSAPYNQGDTMTHEVGHWFELYHTFDSENCVKNTGDFVRDTAAELSPAYECRTGRNTCLKNSGNDPITNFMDYTDDGCMFKFTRGQAERMDAAAEIFRRL